MDHHVARPIDVLVFGEAVVDFLPERPGRLRNVDRFQKAVGGAPANLALTLARLGGTPKLLSRLGEDEFGRFLYESLEANGVDVSESVFTHHAQTGVTFISLASNGERSFHGFRNRSADLTVTPEDFCHVEIKAPIVHAGSTQMTYPEGHQATRALLKRARQAGALVTMDANIRFHLWEREADILPALFETIGEGVDLLKTNEEELQFLAQGKKLRQVYEMLHKERGLEIMVVTLGEGGARVLGPDLDLHVDGQEIHVVDSTGAGDAFVAGLLYGLLAHAPRSLPPKEWLPQLNEKTWRKTLALANFTGGCVCRALGATTLAPYGDEVPWEQLGWAPDERLRS